MHPIHTRIFFLLLFSSSLVAATNFTQCLQDFMSDPNAVGGVDSKGQPTSPTEAVGLTYEACTELCGTGPEAFNWRTFAQLFSAWLLPWLALISQLPFGSGNYVDDFVSVVLSLGSPALAAYSLVLTSLNTRSAYRKVKRAELQNKIAVTRALISVQQAPLELTTDGRLLASIPDNGHWGQEIKERLYRRNAWSVATASSIAWVVIAYLFTLVDSFVSLNDGTNNPSEGQAVGTIWLWLICLVIGWLWVPTFTHGELKSAIRRANEKAAKKAAKMIKQKASHAYSSVKTKISHGISKEISILTGHEQPRGQPVADPVPEVDEDSVKVEIETIEEDTGPTGEEVGLGHIPLPDLAYDQPSASLQLPVGSQHDHGHLTVSASLTINHSSLSVQSSICPQKHRLLTDIDKGLGQLNRDEHRFGATFNYSRFIRHRVLVDAVLKALDKFAHEKDEDHVSEVTSQPAGTVFPPGTLTSMFIASIFAFILQCGPTAAAAIIMIFTPMIGLGCRSLGYVIYGAVALLILFLTVISTISARIAETRGKRSPTVKSYATSIAVTLRCICLILAFINATGLIVLSCFQFSSFLDNCYCGASVIGRGTDSFIIINFEAWIPTMRNSRIGATVLAGVSMAVYMLFLWFMSSLPADIDEDGS